ncbi:hypothetical protein BC834DRAFT_818707 [Gloeopeniophorella convolvens]|nr:hypothetical protein BC834DRAFT_818707 [Gloeopeniophorella convolvens]
MPKVPTAKQDSALTASPMGSGSHPVVLKRNQACHQCRRRKLKCDAQRPCSTCVRSHAHAVSHAPAGVVLPERPECTFDEGAVEAQEPPNPKNRFEKLESRINELEAMLKDQSPPSNGISPHLSVSPPGVASPSLPTYSGLATTAVPSPASGSSMQQPSSALGTRSDYQTSTASVFVIGDLSQKGIPPLDDSSEIVNISTTASDFRADSSFVPNGTGYDLFWVGWPQDLPAPNLLRHLVDVFFAFHPHACRLFHAPTFMASLNLSPSHPSFPSPPVLHAICAVGSLYTAAVLPTPPPDKRMAAGMFEDINFGQPFNSGPPSDELFGNRYKRKDHVDSFAEKHVKFARELAEEQIWAGKRLFENVQALLIITWWHWSNARWVEAFMNVGQALRALVPLGLNICAPFVPITEGVRPPSLIPPPESIIEDEVRRNTFWLVYIMERMCGCSNGWALSMDDSDVSQLLPLKSVYFDVGVSRSLDDRQHALGKDVVLIHPEDQTDSFSLYVKGSMILSRVKTFNTRFRVRRFMDDPAYAYAPAYAEVWEKNDEEARNGSSDPRRTSAFIEVDHIASMFRQSFPLHLRHPIRDDGVDCHLYAACTIPNLAIILLHDPHAHVYSPGCVSAFKILEASRGILDLIHAVRSTSFDITLLDFFCAFSWFMAGRVLIRFLQAALDAKSEEQSLTLRAEVEYIMSALEKFGEGVPVAHRYFRMLNEVAAKTCGVRPNQPADNGLVIGES